MAKTKTELKNELRGKYLRVLLEYLAGECDEDAMQVASNQIAFPVVDGEGNGEYIVLEVKIPTGSRDGEPYDAYEMAKAYNFKCEQDAIKAAKKAELKAKKMAKDEARRQAQAKAKAKVEEKAVE